MPTDIYTLGIGVDSTDVKQADASLDDLALSADRAGNEVEDFGNKANVANKRSKTLGTSAKTAKTAVSGVGRSAGQAGIQIQQMVGQIQGGQSAFVALSQQGADLGIVLGAPLVGVIVSLGAVIAGALVNSLSGATDKFKELSKEIRESKADWQEFTQAQKNIIELDLNNRIKERTKLMAEEQEKLAKLDKQAEGFRARMEALINTEGKHEEAIATWQERLEKINTVYDIGNGAVDTHRQKIEELRNEIGILNGEADKGAKSEAPWWGTDESVQAAAFAIEMDLFKQHQIAIDEARQENLTGYQSILQMQYQSKLAYNQMDMEAEKAHLANLKIAYSEYADSRVDSDIAAREKAIKTEEAMEAAKIKTMSNLNSAFTTFMDSENRALFEIGKIGAAGQALMSADVAAAKALELGPIAGPIAAGVMWTAGAARAASIMSRSFGNTSASPPTTPEAPTVTQPAESVQNIQNTFNIAGGDGVGIVEQIQEAFDSGALQIKNGSVNSVYA